jgi:hypothetical protein
VVLNSRYWDGIQSNIVHLCLARKVKSDMTFRVPFEPFSPVTLLTVELSRGWDSLNMSAAQCRSHNVTSHVDCYTKRPKVSWAVNRWFIPQELSMSHRIGRLKISFVHHCFISVTEVMVGTACAQSPHVSKLLCRLRSLIARKAPTSDPLPRRRQRRNCRQHILPASRPSNAGNYPFHLM